jgi:hypothetical protein
MLIAIASLALASTPVPAAQAPTLNVDVGRFNEADFPEVGVRERRVPHETLIAGIETVLRERRCRFQGQSHRRFDLRVPYVVHLEPDGRPTRFVVADMGCQPLETYVGEYILEMARLRDFRPTGTGRAGWYRSEVRFIVGNYD